MAFVLIFLPSVFSVFFLFLGVSEVSEGSSSVGSVVVQTLTKLSAEALAIYSIFFLLVCIQCNNTFSVKNLRIYFWNQQQLIQ